MCVCVGGYETSPPQMWALLQKMCSRDKCVSGKSGGKSELHLVQGRRVSPNQYSETPLTSVEASPSQLEHA